MDRRASSQMNASEDLSYFFRKAGRQPNGSFSVIDNHGLGLETEYSPNENICHRKTSRGYTKRSQYGHCSQQMSAQQLDHLYAKYHRPHPAEQQHACGITRNISYGKEGNDFTQTFEDPGKPNKMHYPTDMTYYSQHMEEESIPTYDGNSSFNDFIVQFECISSIYKWSYETKGQKLMMSLKDKAVGVLGTLQASQRTDFESLKTTLQNRFDTILDQDLTGLQWQKRKKKKNESYISFAMDLKKLLMSTYLNWPKECIERLAREHFFSCIDNKYLRGLLWSKTPVDVTEAASMADSLEELFKNRKIDRHENAYTHVQVEVEDEQRKKEFHQHEIIDSAYEYRVPISKARENRLRRRRKKRCHICQQEGHLVRDCPEVVREDQVENCWMLRLMAKPQQTVFGQRLRNKDSTSQQQLRLALLSRMCH